MRISDALMLAGALLVAGCDRSADPRVAAGAVTQADSDKGRIACRLGDGRSYEPVCTAERATADGGTLLTLRGPDGGFHRVLVGADGRSVAAADGAEPAMASVADGVMEVAVAGDRYRLSTR